MTLSKATNAAVAIFSLVLLAFTTGCAHQPNLQAADENASTVANDGKLPFDHESPKGGPSPTGTLVPKPENLRGQRHRPRSGCQSIWAPA